MYFAASFTNFLNNQLKLGGGGGGGGKTIFRGRQNALLKSPKSCLNIFLVKQK